MQIEKPYKSRAIIEETMNSVTITIPAKRNFFTVFFTLFGLSSQIFIGYIFSTLMLRFAKHVPDTFWVLFLGGFGYSIVTALLSLLWYIIGKEVITIERGILTLKKVGAPFARTKSYAIADTGNFRTVETNNSFWNRNKKAPYREDGAIIFDYGMKSKEFGMGIDEPEAIYLVNFLKEKELIPNK